MANLNNMLVNKLEDLVAFIQNDMDTKDNKTQIADKFRLKTITRVIIILKKYPKKITLDNYMELSNIDGIGKGSIARIKEILETNNLEEIKGFINTKKEMKQSMEELELVVGIGKKNAMEFYKQGITTVKMLKDKIKKKEIEVNNKILLGLKYYGKYHMNIPRSEMDKYNKFFTKLIKKINKSLKLDSTNEYLVEICGSYRREKPVSNDIDVLITKKDTSNIRYNYLEKIVDKLKKPLKSNNNKPLLIDSMTDKKIKTKYMGFSKLEEDLIRRIDIRFVPYTSFYSAILYFTGSGDFNQKMRIIAKKKGYKLNEYGLYDKNDNIIHLTSERDIFKKLDMEYLPPRLR